MFCKKGAVGNFTKFTGKHLCQSLFFNKVADLVCNFMKKETLAQVFSCEFCKISMNTFSYRTPLVAASILNYRSSLPSCSLKNMFLKLLQISKENCFIRYSGSTLKMIKNAFYFNLKAFFFLRIFLSSLFGHVEKTA